MSWLTPLFEALRDLLHPAGHGVARDVDVVARFEDLLLPIEWKVIGVFADGDVGL